MDIFIKNYTSGSRITAEGHCPAANISGAYLKHDNDSLIVQMYSSFDADMIVTNSTGEPLAALKFRRNPVYIWISSDLEKATQESLAAFFAVIIGIRDL